MGGLTGEALTAFRLYRTWDRRELARRIAMAARSAGIHVAPRDSLLASIRRWEAGVNEPSERHLLLIRHVFPALLTPDGELTERGTRVLARHRAGYPVNGIASHGPEDPAAVLDRSRHLPGDTAALEAEAVRSGRPELIAMAAAVRDIEQQIAGLRDQLARQLALLRDQPPGEDDER